MRGRPKSGEMEIGFSFGDKTSRAQRERVCSMARSCDRGTGSRGLGVGMESDTSDKREVFRGCFRTSVAESVVQWCSGAVV